MNANLNFKFGKWSNLPDASASTLGTVFVTTDEQAMYIDLPKEGSTNGVGRLRIGDIIVHSDVRDITPPYHPGAFYYIENGNALLRYNAVRDESGNIKTDDQGNVVYSWVQINSTEAINAQVNRLQLLIDDLEEADENFAKSLESYLLAEDFNSFVDETYTPTIAGINKSIADTADSFSQAMATEKERVEGLIGDAKDEASTALGEAKEELQGNINKKVDKTSYESTIEDINESIAALQDKDNAIDEAMAAETERVNTLVEGAKTEASTALGEAKEELQEAINGKVDKTGYENTIDGINRSIAALQEKDDAIDQAMANEAERVDGAIGDAKEEVLGALGEAQEALQEAINGKVSQATYDQAISGINKSIGALQEKDDAIEGAMDAEKERINGLIDALQEADGNLAKALEDYLLAETFNDFVTDTYTPAIAKINKSIDDTAAAFNKDLTEEAERVDAALENYLRHDGGNKITGTIELEDGATITNVQDPTTDNDIVSAGYMKTSISNALEALNAMTFKGDVNIDSGKDLPDTANVGDTYIVSYAGEYTIDSTGTTDIKQFARIGDLFINSAEKDDDKPEWIHVSGGLEQYYLQEIRSGADNNKQFISLTDGLHYGDNLTEENIVGKIYFTTAEDSNLNFSITAETDPTDTSKKTGNHIVTANLTWGTFDPPATEGEN